ncbi:unnamed protein product [Jaminaea pallidilutea]
MSPPIADARQRRKRSKQGIKIKRNRKITSCLGCRERKQKCDRTHPVCQKCVEDGRKCIYVDHETTTQGDGAEAGPSRAGEPDSPSKRQRTSDSSEQEDDARTEEEVLSKRRQKLIRETYIAGKDRNLPFQDRVKAARAAAVAEVLFAENGGMDLMLRASLKLPTRQQAEPLLDSYKSDVQVTSNILIIDLNRARICSFLDWWHSKPEYMPPEADAPLAPLVLVVLALALQAQRTRNALESGPCKDERGFFFAALFHNEPLFPWVSSERFLLETAGRCINALQVACPSSWAAAYSAPLDVVRAETLRALWHLGECHIQFAGSCISQAVRLAYAAGLHRDPKHWTTVLMSDFEVQARRSAWWNIATMEVFHSYRIGQPSVVAHGVTDTELPTDYDAIVEQYRLTNSPHKPPCKVSFDAITSRFYLASLMVNKSTALFGVTNHVSSRRGLQDKREVYDRWLSSINGELRRHMDEVDAVSSLSMLDEGLKWEVVGLQLNVLQGRISNTRHHNELSALRPESASESSSNLQICLEAAARIVYLGYKAINQRPGAPCTLLTTITYYTFNTACMLAIQSTSPIAKMSVCRPALEQALAVLDHLGRNERLGNISEQADRYAATVRDICEGKATATGGEMNLSLPRKIDRATEPPSNVGEDEGEGLNHKAIRSSGLFTNARVPQSEPVSNASPAPRTANATAPSDWSSRGQTISGFPSMRPNTSSSTSGLGASLAQPAPALKQPVDLVPQDASAGAENFFNKTEGARPLHDRPLPGDSNLSLSFLSALFPDEINGVGQMPASDHQSHLPTPQSAPGGSSFSSGSALSNNAAKDGAMSSASSPPTSTFSPDQRQALLQRRFSPMAGKLQAPQQQEQQHRQGNFQATSPMYNQSHPQPQPQPHQPTMHSPLISNHTGPPRNGHVNSSSNFNVNPNPSTNKSSPLVSNSMHSPQHTSRAGPQDSRYAYSAQNDSSMSHIRPDVHGGNSMSQSHAPGSATTATTTTSNTGNTDHNVDWYSWERYISQILQGE